MGQAPPKKEIVALESFESTEQVVLKTLLDGNNKQLAIDELSWRSNVPISKLASVLLALEFKGAVSSLPGKIYKALI